MTSIDAETVRRLRGQLGQDDPDRAGRGPGARGLEHMARNRRCQRLTAVTLAGASADAAARKLGVSDRSENASPFAAARGARYEEHLFADNCRRVFEVYVRAGLLDSLLLDEANREHAWLDTEKGPEGKGEFSFTERRRVSEDLILRRARGDRKTPVLILKPRLAVKLAGQEVAIEPDALVAGYDDACYRVAEIKSYADRRGYTNQSKTASAARQAAVGALAVRQLLADHDLDPSVLPATADLIFSNSGSNTPTLNRLDIRGELANITAALSNTDAQLDAILAVTDGRSLDTDGVLEALATHLCSSCASHCPMFEHCRTDAIRQGHPVMLGDSAAEMLGPTGSLKRALQLRDATVTPRDDDEQVIAAMLAAAHAAQQHALLDPTEYPSSLEAEIAEDDSDELDGLPLFGSDRADEQENLEIAS